MPVPRRFDRSLPERDPTRLNERIRVPDDRRIVLVRSTDAGRQMLADVEVLKDEMLQRVIARLDDIQLRHLVKSLEDVRTAALAVFADDPNLGRHDHSHDHNPDAHHGADHSHQPLEVAPAPAPLG